MRRRACRPPCLKPGATEPPSLAADAAQGEETDSLPATRRFLAPHLPRLATERLEREDSGAVPIPHLIVRRLEDHSAMLDGLHRLDLPGGRGDPRLPAPPASLPRAIPRLGRSRDFH
ncbi:hypothetical protein MVG78_14180 [Roseomonas gilardii subsp. gilardii]|uniref:hypothetical protein n=1 Tax=Roseomonas gilardii TaxID=257708 RepID=UPI001FF8DD59|nr:hypothetical protein [Roseomonas gilardii]UPG71689.1 hypothetical protein MVG78_14180 [Roseomonas gilardii subsp. gilardii]